MSHETLAAEPDVYVERPATGSSREVVAPLTWRELGLFAAACLALFALLAVCSHPAVLFGRALWLDEYLTHLVVTSPTVGGAVAAVRAGVDTNPPTFHLLLRAFSKLIGVAGPVPYRIVAAASVYVAVVLAYALVRRAFGVWPSVVAALAVWAHPLFVVHSWEARFYGPLLAATAIFCTVFTGPNRLGRWRPLVVVLASLLLCSIHYFGIISAAAVCAGELLLDRSPFRAKLRRLVPVLLGSLVVLTFPTFIRGQAEGLTVKTWSPPFDPVIARRWLVSLVKSGAFGVIAFVGVAASVYHAVRKTDARGATGGAIQRLRARLESLEPLGGMCGLLLVPLPILIFSLLVQPTLVSRYLITAVLGLTPFVALVVYRWPRPLLIGIGVVLVTINLWEMREFGEKKLKWQRDQEALVAHWRATDPNVPIVTFARNQAYVFAYLAPDLAKRTLIVDFGPHKDPDLSEFLLFETQLASKALPFYDALPQPRTVDRLAKLRRFYLMAGEPAVAAARVPLLTKRLPLRKVGEDLYTADTGTSASAR